MIEKSTKIFNEADDVESQLKKIGLTRTIVQEVAFAAASARADSISVDPTNAPGLLSYIYGVRALRLQLLKNGWRQSRENNIESTVNDELGVQLCFQNVHTACSESKIPHAISGKGPGSRELVAAGQGDLFNDAPKEKKVSHLGEVPTVWVLCVASDGYSISAEVSCPTSFEGSQFDDFHCRIFVVNEDFDGFEPSDLPENDYTDDIEIQISRKQ